MWICGLFARLRWRFSSGCSAAAVGMIVGFGLTGGVFGRTVLGVLSPLFFARIGVDPAVASGPIVTAFNDFLSMFDLFFDRDWAQHFPFLRANLTLLF